MVGYLTLFLRKLTSFLPEANMDSRESIRNEVDTEENQMDVSLKSAKQWIRKKLVGENHADVSLKLAKQIFSTDANEDSNLVFSPLCINVILSLTTVGSDGPMRDELLNFLKSKSIDDLNRFYSQMIRDIIADPRLSMANGVWVEQTRRLKPSFKHVATDVYKAVSESVDFKNKANEVAEQVNLWVEKETKGLIQEILPIDSVSKRTRLVLANALYFKGDWAEKFDVCDTNDYNFHLLNGKSIQVPFMRNNNMQCVEVYNGFKALRLPYKRGDDDYKRLDFSMYIFLPDAKDGLPSLINKACSELGFLEQHLPKHAIKLDRFSIPRFKISYKFEASNVLKELGLVSPFKKFEGEGLTEMVFPDLDSEYPEKGLFVSKIFHKAFIDVSEDGTEASAACVESDDDMGFSLYDTLPPPITFVADHPFLFFIREDLSGAIVFIGTLLNPLSH